MPEEPIPAGLFSKRAVWLPVVYPDNRALWISLGCALENLLIAAQTYGYAPEVTYPNETEMRHIPLSTDTPSENLLFRAITRRQNARSEYDGRLVRNADFDTLQGLPAKDGVTLRFLATPEEMEIAQEYVYHDDLAQYADRPPQ